MQAFNDQDRQEFRKTKYVKLKHPLNLNIEELSHHLKNSIYRGPVPPLFEDDEDDKSEFISYPNGEFAPIVILGFDNKEAGGFTEIVSSFTGEELSSILSVVPPKLIDPIRSALNGTELELSETTAEQNKKFTLKMDEEQLLITNREIEKENRLKRFRKYDLPKEDYANFKAEEGEGILQHCFGYTDAKNDKPVLWTVGVGPCVALAIYNNKTKTAALAHIDDLTTLDSIDKIFDELSKNNDAILEVHIASRDISSGLIIHDLLKLIENKKNIRIVSTDLMEDGDAKSLVIDARTGEVHNNVHDYQINFNKDNHEEELLINYISSPLKKSYDGRTKMHEFKKSIIRDNEAEYEKKSYKKSQQDFTASNGSDTTVLKNYKLCTQKPNHQKPNHRCF